MKLVMFYCVYEPDNVFMGYKRVVLKSTRWADAEKECHKLLEQATLRGKWEYFVYEVKEETGSRVYDNKQHKRL